MEKQKFFSVENGKELFIEMIKIKALYNEKQREISDAIHKVRTEIENTDTLISSTIDTLAKSLFMSKAKKAKKYAYIEELKEQKAAGEKKIEELELRIEELKRETFGCDGVPHFLFGRYKQTPDAKDEPLEWDVIRLNDGMALLLCVKIIEQMPYAESFGDTPWKDSLIRKWTNGEFYQNSFSDAEKSMILETEVANPGNSIYKTAPSSNTRDYIFIPSVKDARRFCNYDSDRIAWPTGYAASKELYVDEENGAAYWWLRSNGGNMYNAAVVNFKGYIFEYGCYVVSSEYGVRPAMWIRLTL